MKALLHVVAVVLALVSGGSVHAQTAATGSGQAYPNKPVRVMVGYVPGGGVDLAARLAAAVLGDLWGVTALVDNRPGAAGGIATEITAKATPDGYTLMLCQIASHAITPARNKNLPYDHIKDFAFVSMIGSTPNVFVVHPSVPIKSLGEFIAYAKANPGKLSFGSSGVGASPHLSIELLKSMTGIDIVHVPYKGAAAALADVMGGQIPASVGNLPGGLLAAIKAGRVRALGVTSAQRNPQAPDVPTFAESGVAGYDVSSWYGICTQAAVPQRILAKLNADLVKVLNSPELQQRMQNQGIDVTPSTPEQFLAHVKSETAKWAKVVRDTGLVGD
jgi:tripartite-type tricarboxylate transporter receptor subunit TctC